MDTTVSPASPIATEANLQHLQAELARIDVLIHHAVQRWQAAGQNPGDAFRGLSISVQEAEALAQRPLGAGWGQMVTLPAEVEADFERAQRQADDRVWALEETARAEGWTPRLVHLANAFQLDRFDLDTLLICVAQALDLRYERLYGFLQDDITRKRPSASLVLTLLSEPGIDRLGQLSHFEEDAPLVYYHLIEPSAEPGSSSANLLSMGLQIDPAIVAWLLGGYHPHRDLGSHACLLWPGEEEADHLLAAPLTDRLELSDLRAYGSEDTPIFIFYGPDLSGQEAAARLCAAAMERPLLRVDLSAVIWGGADPRLALLLALRDASLTGALPFLCGWDACLEFNENRAGRAESTPPPGAGEGGPFLEILAELCSFPGLVIVSGKSSWKASGVERNTPLFWFEFPAPPYPQRRALWEHFLNTVSYPYGKEELDLTTLAGQFALTGGQIRDAIATAIDRSLQEKRPLENGSLLSVTRTFSSPYLGSLARKIKPRYAWTDIILPDDQITLLHEIVATVRNRPVVLEEWGVGQKLVPSAGIPMLFSGPPGTGKTMAAEVIANELGLDLYKIELSSVVSKYIGETEKNLERIFDEAEHSNAILFFDEADAIFGKRSEVKDAHDRYANIEISYLLQRMELYEGVTILATNLRANLDEAFTRRLQFVVDYPFPEQEYRLRIWQTLFPPDIPRAPDLDFNLLAQRYKLAGGNIRNIIVSAAYLAAADGQPVAMDHLMHAVRREMQKMGRLVKESDFSGR